MLVITNFYLINLNFRIAKDYETSGRSSNRDPENILLADLFQSISLILIFIGIGLISAYFYSTEKKLSSGYSKYFIRSMILIFIGAVIATICLIVAYKVSTKPAEIIYENGILISNDLVDRYKSLGIITIFSVIGYFLIYLGVGLFIFGFVKLKYLATPHGKQTSKRGGSSREFTKFVMETFNEKVKEESIEIEPEEDAEEEEIEYAEVVLD